MSNFWVALLIVGHVVLTGLMVCYCMSTLISKEASDECSCSESVWISWRSFFGAYRTITLRIHEQSCENGLPVKPEIVSLLRTCNGSHYDQKRMIFFWIKPDEEMREWERKEARLFKRILAKFPSSIWEGVREHENAPEPGSDLFVGFRWG